MKCFVSTKISLVLIFIIATAVSTTALGSVMYVDSRANGANIGTDWNNAFRSLQDAMYIAYWSQKPVEIRVARGIYMPDQGLVNTPEDRTETFLLINGVTVKGGYAGHSSSNPDARNIEQYKTVLSGDLLGDDMDVDSPGELVAAENRFDNSLHVVVAAEVGQTAVLDGFTIQGGYANQIFDNYGGGMYNYYANPTIINCIFEDNYAGVDALSWGDGAGMSNYNSNPTLTHCIFRGNCAGYAGIPTMFFPGVTGGGITNYQSDPILTDCIFDRNLCFDAGGAMFNYQSHPEINNCTFNANLTLEIGFGGMMYNSESNVEMTNCLITLNASGRGGAIQSETSDATITNCTFADNFSMDGGNSFWCDSYILDPSSNINLANCIIWDGDDLVLNEDGSEIIIHYSNVQGGWSGSGGNNMDADPLFAEPGYWVHIEDPDIILGPEDPNAVQVDGDYHLKSQEGRWDPISQSWVQDDVTSPCIDAGDPASSWTDESWPHGERINMGAYGGTDQASMSFTQEDGGQGEEEGEGEGEGEGGEGEGQGQMELPANVAYVYSSNVSIAGRFESLLESNGITVSLVHADGITAMSLSSYDLIIVADDTYSGGAWNDDGAVVAVENSGKPVVGLGKGGYTLFSKLDLFIGDPHGVDQDCDSIYAVNPDLSLYSWPCEISIPADQVIQLYSYSGCTSIYLPSEMEGVVKLGQDAGNIDYYPLIIEQNKYTLWGFRKSPNNMTDAGKALFVNTVAWTANGG
jgi:hypothetical protein